MTEPDVFVLADRALARVVAQVRDDQWETVLPATFGTRHRPEPPSLRTLVNHHAYDDAWVPDMLAGRTMADAGADTFDGDLLGGTTPWPASRPLWNGPSVGCAPTTSPR
jgi:hypothetical protein